MIKYLFTLLIFALFSCGIYRQNVVNVPLMQQKGQTQLSAHMGYNGLEGQATYALTNNIALLANYSDMGLRKKEYSTNNYETRKHHFKEIGAGMYKKNASGNIQEFFVLAGKGMTSRFVTGRNSAGGISTTSQEVGYNRFVVQADFGRKHKKLEQAITPRLLAVHYNSIADNTSNNYKELSNFHVYAEVAATLRYPILKYLVMSGQAGVTLPLTHRKGSSYYEFSPLNGSIGLLLNIDLVKRDK